MLRLAATSPFRRELTVHLAVDLADVGVAAPEPPLARRRARDATRANPMTEDRCV